MSGNPIQPLTSLLTRAPAENLRKPEDLAVPEELVDLRAASTIHDDGAVMIQRQMHIANVARRLLEVPSRDPSDATAFTAAVNHKTAHTDHPFLSYLQYILYHTITGGIYTLLIGYGVISQKFADVPVKAGIIENIHQF